MEITEKDLKKYENLTDVQRKIRPSNDFTQETFDYFNLDEHLSGVKLPFTEFDDLFRLRSEEITLLAGINGAGKSLFASQVLLSAMDQGRKCLSVSLEMSPKSQLARMWRQASLQNKPDIDAGLQFTIGQEINSGSTISMEPSRHAHWYLYCGMRWITWG
jgi:replicative DNA helicase